MRNRRQVIRNKAIEVISLFTKNAILIYDGKGTYIGSSARRTKELLKLNRDQLRWVVGLLTGHCHIKGHLFKLGLTD
jgi:hypothetical protein